MIESGAKSSNVSSTALSRDCVDAASEGVIEPKKGDPIPPGDTKLSTPSEESSETSIGHF